MWLTLECGTEVNTNLIETIKTKKRRTQQKPAAPNMQHLFTQYREYCCRNRGKRTPFDAWFYREYPQFKDVDEYLYARSPEYRKYQLDLAAWEASEEETFYYITTASGQTFKTKINPKESI